MGKAADAVDGDNRRTLQDNNQNLYHGGNAKEQLEKCQKNIETWQKQCSAEIGTFTFEQYQSGEWSEKIIEFQKQFEELSQRYLEKSIFWYEKYQEYEEAFSDYVE